MGEAVRYDGKSKKRFDFDKRFEYHLLCPEILGGLSVPREACEIVNDKVISASGKDLTEAFNTGANAVIEYIQKHQIEMVVLKQNSPSCGSRFIYDGSFKKRKIEGMGVTARLLKQHKIKVLDETQWLAYIRKGVVIDESI